MSHFEQTMLYQHMSDYQPLHRYEYFDECTYMSVTENFTTRVLPYYTNKNKVVTDNNTKESYLLNLNLVRNLCLTTSQNKDNV
jgi:hypothetical protein